MNTTITRDLERLTHSGLELADPSMDFRGRDAYDRNGEPVGTVADVLIDPEQRKARMLEVVSGGGLLGLGKRQFLVPVESIAGGDAKSVHIDRLKDEILAGPAYQRDQIDEEEAHYAAVYAHYDVTPYWVVEPSGEKIMGSVQR
jgi:sporulation protein YlmC with PRC-barrel domain